MFTMTDPNKPKLEAVSETCTFIPRICCDLDKLRDLNIVRKRQICLPQQSHLGCKQSLLKHQRGDTLKSRRGSREAEEEETTMEMLKHDGEKNSETLPQCVERSERENSSPENSRYCLS